MIVLTISQKNALLSAKENFNQDFYQNNVDIVPVAIKNDLFILPDRILSHPVLGKLFENFTEYTKREVLQNELIIQTK